MKPSLDTPVTVVRHDLGCGPGCPKLHEPGSHVAVHVVGQCSEQPDPDDDPDAVQTDGRWRDVTCIICRVRWRGHLARGGQQTLEGSA